jgi:hypothetical protein
LLKQSAAADTKKECVVVSVLWHAVVLYGLGHLT